MKRTEQLQSNSELELATPKEKPQGQERGRSGKPGLAGSSHMPTPGAVRQKSKETEV